MHMDWHYPLPPATTADPHNPPRLPCHTHIPLTSTPLLTLARLPQLCSHSTYPVDTHTPLCTLVPTQPCTCPLSTPPPPLPQVLHCLNTSQVKGKPHSTGVGAPDRVSASSLGADSPSPESMPVLWASVPLFIEGCCLLPNLKGYYAGSDFARAPSLMPGNELGLPDQNTGPCY